MAVELGSKVEPLSAKEAARLLFLSFKFSQGVPGLQKDLLLFLKQTLPNRGIDDYREVLSAIYPLAEAYLQQKRGALHKEVDLLRQPDPELESNAYKMSEVFASHPSIRSDLIIVISQEIIGQDLLYLKGQGRARSSLNIRSNSQNYALDPWLSHFRFYALESHPAGHWAFDRMFTDIRSLYEAKPGEPCFSYLPALTQLWEDKHPGLKFFAETNS